MKLSTLTFLVATTCSLLGCSSSPLAGASDSEAGAGPAAVPSASGGASAGVGASAGASAVAVSPTSTWTPYPAGPYGTTRGATIENLSFMGWKHPDLAGYDPDKFELVRLSDFYDPNALSGIKLLAINASAVWCGVCRREYQEMHSGDVYNNLHPLGLEILGTLFQDNQYYPAQPQDLKNWAKLSTHAVTFPFVLDPGFKVGAYFDSDATPLNMLVDVRTMTIVQITMGISDPTSDYWDKVQAMLEKM
ncbi:MAG TPA: hypothetical protein VGJ91_21290 [Polyangiaceae bacterium]|jgi:hypothetical protein